jgi:signal transduction histidine kinase
MMDKRLRAFNRRLSTLLFLVLFVFIVLLVSIFVSIRIAVFLVSMDMIPPIIEANRLQLGFTFTLLVSLLIGIVMTVTGGKYFLRPLQRLNSATKEIASGNFNVHVDTIGSKEMVSLAESFNEMAAELASVETLRSDFVSNISHEFKTPVASIKGFAKRLKKNSLTQEQRDEYLDIILSESERLIRLSGNVLLLSKLESTVSDNEKSSFSLDEQIRRTVLLLEPQLQIKGIEIDVNLEEVMIIANEEMLHHLWINLLSNAIKFSPYGGTVGIALKQNGENIIVSVSDAGIGMDEEVKKHIFDKFYQGDRSRATAGNGLGLSLVKRILELEGGRVEVDSELDKGTCFTISLPI